jgi:hypothetical protein
MVKIDHPALLIGCVDRLAPELRLTCIQLWPSEQRNSLLDGPGLDTEGVRVWWLTTASFPRAVFKDPRYPRSAPRDICSYYTDWSSVRPQGSAPAGCLRCRSLLISTCLLSSQSPRAFSFPFRSHLVAYEASFRAVLSPCPHQLQHTHRHRRLEDPAL